jgi:RNA polymerase sigma factor (sigma-70 family)
VDIEELFEAVYPQLHRYCVRLTADTDVAEDAAQEAFVRFLDREVSGGPSGAKAWLFKVATHLIRDRARVRDNRARLLEANPVTPPEPGNPHDQVERAERVARVRRALETLDERDRTLLLLREEGLSYRELAEVIEVKASSVGTLLARARERLTQALKGSARNDHARNGHRRARASQGKEGS